MKSKLALHSRRHIAAVFLLSAVVSSLLAQEDDDTTQPTLPEVIVEAPAVDDGVGSAVPGFEELWRGDTVFSPGEIVGYGAAGSVTGTRMAVAPLDFPGSVQTIPEIVMQDQAADQLHDLLRDVSGLNHSNGGGSNRTDDLLIRGFRIRGNSDDFRKNGFRDSSRVQRELSNVERIEVLKGPASILYGAVGEPAGLVNFITKQPLDYRYDAVSATFGYFNDYRFTLDSTGPLATGLPLTYRLNMAVQDSGSFRDFVYNERFFISPVLRWQINERTRLTFEGEFLYDERMTDRGIPIYQGDIRAVPISRFLGEPTDGTRFNDGQTAVVLDHQFNDSWSLHTGWVSNWSDEDRDSTDTRGGLQGTNLRRRRIFQEAIDENHYWMADVAGTVTFGCMEHEFVFGTEIGTTRRDDFSVQRNVDNINIFTPIYGPQSLPNRARMEATDHEQYAIYLQDLVSVTPRLKLLAGFRQDWVDATSLDTNAAPNPMSDSQAATSPRFGVVYQLIPDAASFYAAYSESFQPVVGSSLSGVAFGPEQGAAYETGIKLELLDQQLWFTLAAFDIFRQNILVPDPADDNYSLQLGEAESKGVEFDLAGRLSPSWSIIANAAYMDTRVTEDTQAGMLGNRLLNVPYISSSLWTRYDFIDSPSETAGAALGVVYVGQRAGDADNSFELPSYTRWDAGLYYRLRAVNLRLYAENLFDVFYFASSRNTVRNLPGAPFNLRGTVELTY